MKFIDVDESSEIYVDNQHILFELLQMKKLFETHLEVYFRSAYPKSVFQALLTNI